MSVTELIRNGRVEEALAMAEQEIRANPAESKLRVSLFQILCVLGRWERALTQLQVLREMDADSQMLAHVFRTVLDCEAFRGEVFSGKRTPLIFGEPSVWIGELVQACQLVAQGKIGSAEPLRRQAFESAPAVAGKLNGQPFEWIADADSRLGPVLEAIVEGRYYWVPFDRVHKIQIDAPVDLRDLVWVSAQFTWSNGGQAPGFIPVRYSGTESQSDNALRLARRTDWQSLDGETYLGVGQRLLATDTQEMPLLEVRTLEIGDPPPSAIG